MVKSSGARSARKTWRPLARAASMATGAVEDVAVVADAVGASATVAVAHPEVAAAPSLVPSLPLSGREDLPIQTHTSASKALRSISISFPSISAALCIVFSTASVFCVFPTSQSPMGTTLLRFSGAASYLNLLRFVFVDLHRGDVKRE